MNTTARLITHENDLSQEPWVNDQLEYARRKRKLAPTLAHKHQYELLQSSSRATTEHGTAADHTISHIPTIRSGGWLWEAISFAIAVACWAALVGMLFALDDKQVPTWPSGISVNAILSVIVTIMKGAMGTCVAECLSQIKWSWFKRDRKLIDLVIIDEASRGVWGAGRLLFTLRAWYLAYIGSFIFLTAFIIGPTVQQMVEIRIRQIELPSNATVPICNASYYDVIGLGRAPGMNRVNLPMIGAMYDGFLQTSDQSPLRPNCPTGNCTYPRYQSLGICHQCSDFSHQLVYLDQVTNMTMPISGNLTCSQYGLCAIYWPEATISLHLHFGIFNSTVNDNRRIHPSLESPDNGTIYNFRAVMSRAWQNYQPIPSPIAVRCVIRFCVKTFEAIINAGDFRENVVATSWIDSHMNDATFFTTFENHLHISAKPCYINGTEKLEPWNDEDRAHCVYNIGGMSGVSLRNTLDGLTTGEGTAIASHRPFLSNDVVQAMYGLFGSENLDDPDLGTVKSVDRAFKSLSDAMTNQARGSFANCGGAVAYGIQLIDELYIHVRWIWIIPTTIVLAFCLIFFSTTIMQSWKEDLWKSSPLAYLFHRAIIKNAEFTLERLEPTSKLSIIEKASENINVRFERRMAR